MPESTNTQSVKKTRMKSLLEKFILMPMQKDLQPLNVDVGVMAPLQKRASFEEKLGEERTKLTWHNRKFCRLSAHHRVKNALDLEPISLELLKLQERYVLRWKA